MSFIAQDGKVSFECCRPYKPTRRLSLRRPRHFVWAPQTPTSCFRLVVQKSVLAVRIHLAPPLSLHLQGFSAGFAGNPRMSGPICEQGRDRSVATRVDSAAHDFEALPNNPAAAPSKALADFARPRKAAFAGREPVPCAQRPCDPRVAARDSAMSPLETLYRRSPPRHWQAERCYAKKFQLGLVRASFQPAGQQLSIPGIRPQGATLRTRASEAEQQLRMRTQ